MPAPVPASGRDARAGTKPLGAITRGTTNPNRLRRCDRWLVSTQLHRLPTDPLIVDLGYGATPVTALELHDRLRVVRPRARVVGIEIDPARVAAAQPLAREGLSFIRGGFEIPTPERPHVVRAFNVLRQYDETQVPAAWQQVTARLATGGILVDGTCDELGRRSTWVSLDVNGPLSLTLSWHLGSFTEPWQIAERLPKVLIHRNVAGERIHDFGRALGSAWERNGALASWGRRQRFIATARDLSRDWPIVGGESRWRLGELTLDWVAVAPR